MAQAERALFLPARTEDDADPAVAAVLTAAKQQVGMIPNMYAGMANAPGLLETYLDGYRRFRSSSGFSKVEQEVVFLAISRANACTYCMAAHSTIADKAKVPTEVTDALRAGHPLPDERLDTLARFTAVLVDRRGLPGAEEVDEFLAAGFTEEQVLHIVLAIGVKTLSNYSNHLLHTPVDGIWAARTWEA